MLLRMLQSRHLSKHITCWSRLYTEHEFGHHYARSCVSINVFISQFWLSNLDILSNFSVLSMFLNNQSGRSPKVVALFLLQTLVAIWYDYFNCMIQSKRSHIFGTKFSSIPLAKWEKCLVFRLSFVNLQRAKDGTHMFDAKYRYVFVV